MVPVAIARTETPTGWWELARRAPTTPLSDVIAGFCGYRERSRTVVERTMSAASRLPVIISFGDTIDVDLADGTAGRHESFVAGLHPRPGTTRYQGGQFGVQVDLTRSARTRSSASRERSSLTR